MLQIENFCENFAYLRHISGISVDEMSEILGISVYAVRKIEKGCNARFIRATTLVNIDKYFGVLPSVMFGKDKNMILYSYNEHIKSM